jgi:trimeric autotransporter adhesin
MAEYRVDQTPPTGPFLAYIFYLDRTVYPYVYRYEYIYNKEQLMFAKIKVREAIEHAHEKEMRLIYKPSIPEVSEQTWHTLAIIGEIAVEIGAAVAELIALIFLKLPPTIWLNIQEFFGPNAAEAATEWGESKNAKRPFKMDPLILDLDGNGIKTTNVQAGAFFDHDANGFYEQTGSFAPGDGFLAMDRNGNGIIDDGRELFGTDTILRSGKKATNGFQALADLDSNKDGKIDASDEAFSKLRVLTINANGDAYELRTLEELGIKAVNLNSTIMNQTDIEGNIQNRLGSFDKVDGSAGQIAEYTLQRNTMYTIPTTWSGVPDDIAVLPDLQGYGNVYNLQQAMVRDTTGQLKSLVEQFAAETDVTARNSLMDQIIFEWTGSSDVLSSSRGGQMDARKLVALEKFFGEGWEGWVQVKIFISGGGGGGGGGAPWILSPNPNYNAAVHLNDAYRLLSEQMYAQLMGQTHLKDLYDKISYTISNETQQISIDFNPVIADLQSKLTQDPETGKQELSEFARTLRGLGAQNSNVYLSLRETFIRQDPTLDWVFDTGGLPVYEHLDQGTGWYHWHIFGTENADAVRDTFGEGDGWINGIGGNDVIYGTDRNESLVNSTGDALFVAGGGNDTIYAGEGNNILDGGTGDDTLYGGKGNDTYIFRRGSGHDTIIDVDTTQGNVDTIWLGSDLKPEDVVLRRSGDNLVLKIKDTDDTITTKDFFRNGSTLNRIEQIQFMDGTIWTESDILLMTYSASEDDDVIFGGVGSDNLSGLGGNDTLFGLGGNDLLHGNEGNDNLYGGSGADILDGGTGNDIMIGDAGNDTYLFSRGSGQDTIIDQDNTPGNVDTISLGEGILPTDIKLERLGNDLKLTILDTLDSIVVKDWLQDDTAVHGIEAIQFADGAVWTTETIESILTQGTDAGEVIIGFTGDDTIRGFAGDDTLYARGGNDTIDAGLGNDTVYGEAGNDAILAGEGSDKLVGGSGDDTLEGGAGDDTLLGGRENNFSWDNANGADTYVFGRGSGQDTIVDHDKTAGNMDVIKLDQDIAPTDVTLHRNGDSLELTINDTGDKLTVQNWFWNDSAEYQVEQIQFNDGVIWDVDTIKLKVLVGTSGDDFVAGYATPDTLQGFAGADKLYGRDGDDTLIGGAGNDVLEAGKGNDTYILGLG